MRIPFEQGWQAAKNFIEKLLQQHHVDIQHLWDAVRDLGSAGGRGSGYGARETDAYNISQQFRRYVRLVATCHHGTTAIAAVVQQYTVGPGYGDTTDPAAYPDLAIGEDGAITVNGFFMAGVLFPDEYARVEFDINNGQWYVQDSGREHVRGTLDGALSNGGSQTMTLNRTGSITVYEVLGLSTSIPSGRKMRAKWNKDATQWESGETGCV